MVLPMLLVLFLGVADFGRVFSAGIAVEAIARNAAEAVSGDARLGELKSVTCDAACKTRIYDELHDLAARVACEEASRLLPTTDGGGECLNRIVVGSCVQDGDAAHRCGFAASEAVPDGCGAVKTEPWTATQNGPSGTRADGTTYAQIRTIEVRVCYRFQPLYHAVQLPIVSYLVPESVYLARARTFSVSMDY